MLPNRRIYNFQIFIEDLARQLSLGDSLTLAGLIFTFIGVFLVTISGIFGEKPIRRLVSLIREVDRDSLKDSENTTHDLQLISITDRPKDHPSSSEPVSKADYDALRKRLVRGITGAFLLMFGLILQILGVIL